MGNSKGTKWITWLAAIVLLLAVTKVPVVQAGQCDHCEQVKASSALSACGGDLPKKTTKCCGRTCTRTPKCRLKYCEVCKDMDSFFCGGEGCTHRDEKYWQTLR